MPFTLSARSGSMTRPPVHQPPKMSTASKNTSMNMARKNSGSITRRSPSAEGQPRIYNADDFLIKEKAFMVQKTQIQDSWDKFNIKTNGRVSIHQVVRDKNDFSANVLRERSSSANHYKLATRKMPMPTKSTKMTKIINTSRGRPPIVQRPPELLPQIQLQKGNISLFQTPDPQILKIFEKKNLTDGEEHAEFAIKKDGDIKVIDDYFGKTKAKHSPLTKYVAASAIALSTMPQKAFAASVTASQIMKQDFPPYDFQFQSGVSQDIDGLIGIASLTLLLGASVTYLTKQIMWESTVPAAQRVLVNERAQALHDWRYKKWMR